MNPKTFHHHIVSRSAVLIVAALSLALIGSARAATPSSLSAKDVAVTEREYPLEQADVTPADIDFSKATINSLHGIELILATVLGKEPPSDTAYVVNVVTLSSDKTSTTANNWYLYDPNETTAGGYWGSVTDAFDRKCIGGKMKVALVYVRVTPDGAKDKAVSGAVTYDITQTKGLSTPLANAEALLGILNIKVPTFITDYLASRAPLPPGPYYYIYAATIDVNSNDPHVAAVMNAKYVSFMSKSTWAFSLNFKAQKQGDPVKVQQGGNDNTVNATDGSVNRSGAPASSEATGGAQEGSAASPNGSSTKASTASTSISYDDEPRTNVDFSLAYPVSSYNEITYQSQSPNLVPKSAKQQDLYGVLDVFVPSTQPELEQDRWWPHPFAGFPLTGRPLQHPMVGVSLSIKVGEIFWACVADFDNQSSTGSRSVTYRGVVGIKLSMGAGKSLLGGGNKQTSSSK
jgi:hypothetical protein